MKTKSCHQLWLETYSMQNTIRISHSTETTLSHESRLASSPLAIRESSLAIRDLSPMWRVTNRYLPLMTLDLCLLSREWQVAGCEFRVADRESRVASHGPACRDFESYIWLADLTCGSRIANHAKSWVTDSESRVAVPVMIRDQVASHDWSQLMVFIIMGMLTYFHSMSLKTS